MAADDRAQPQGGSSVPERNKAVVRRLVDEVLNGGRLEVVDELYAPALAPEAKAWITPFRASFPDVHMEVIELIAEGDTVVGRFTCSGTHLGDWLGYAPTGRRFEAIDEVGIYRFRDGRIVETWGLRTPWAAWSSSGCGERGGKTQHTVAGHPSSPRPSPFVLSRTGAAGVSRYFRRTRASRRLHPTLDSEACKVYVQRCIDRERGQPRT